MYIFILVLVQPYVFRTLYLLTLLVSSKHIIQFSIFYSIGSTQELGDLT